MTNKELIDLYISGAKEAKTGSMFIENYVLYSYGYHFPLAYKMAGVQYVNADKYSATTSRHQSLLRQAIGQDEQITYNTDEMIKLTRALHIDAKYQ